MSSKLQRIDDALAERGGVEWLWEQLAGMVEVEAVAKELGCTPRALYLWRDADEERKREWGQALMVSADAYAAEGKAILDALHAKSVLPKAERLESAHVSLATARSNSRMKIAAARNPAAWGERPVVQVNAQLNIAALHLEALQKHGSMARAAEARELAAREVKLLAAPQNESEG